MNNRNGKGGETEGRGQEISEIGRVGELIRPAIKHRSMTRNHSILFSKRNIQKNNRVGRDGGEERGKGQRNIRVRGRYSHVCYWIWVTE